MIDFNDRVVLNTESIEYSIKLLTNNGDSDAVLNYLYTMRDIINKQIKLANNLNNNNPSRSGHTTAE
jgi:hypothetical protein